MGKKYDFEYIIIGSGPAGTTAALTLSKTKKRIAIVEGRFVGGNNLNTRDIPYAVALNFSKLFNNAIRSPELRNHDLTFSFPTIVSDQLRTIVEIGNQQKEALKNSRIVCLEGFAHFLDNHTIAIGDQRFTSENFIIATGSTLKTTEITGVDSVNYLTPETAVKVRRSPKAVLIVGGGPTGCEIATYFAELGTKVLLMETANRILPREDKEVSEVVTNQLSKSLGVMVLPNCKVVALEQDEVSKRVIFRNARTEKLVRVDCVILATGSQPALDFGLENAKVKYKNTGITVNKNFQTTSSNIYAIGDCIGDADSSTERAEYQASVLANNLLNRSKNLPNYNGFPRVINTHPEVAIVGYNEDDLLKRDRKYKKVIVNFNELNAPKITRIDYGFLKLIANKNNHLIGATIVAPNAHLIIGELSLAIRHNLTALEVASTPHNINEYSYAIRLAAKKLLAKKK